MLRPRALRPRTHISFRATFLLVKRVAVDTLAMRYDPAIHHRRSIRLREYDYSAAGYYYVTICTQNRELAMASPDVCRVVEEAWRGLPRRFRGTGLDEYVVMPNHVHGIVIIRFPEDSLTLGDICGLSSRLAQSLPIVSLRGLGGLSGSGITTSE